MKISFMSLNGMKNEEPSDFMKKQSCQAVKLKDSHKFASQKAATAIT